MKTNKKISDIWELELINDMLVKLFGCEIRRDKCLSQLLGLIDKGVVPAICYNCSHISTNIHKNKSPCEICGGEMLLATYLLYNETTVTLKVLK